MELVISSPGRHNIVARRTSKIPRVQVGRQLRKILQISDQKINQKTTMKK